MTKRPGNVVIGTLVYECFYEYFSEGTRNRNDLCVFKAVNGYCNGITSRHRDQGSTDTPNHMNRL